MFKLSQFKSVNLIHKVMNILRDLKIFFNDMDNNFRTHQHLYVAEINILNQHDLPKIKLCCVCKCEIQFQKCFNPKHFKGVIKTEGNLESK